MTQNRINMKFEDWAEVQDQLDFYLKIIIGLAIYSVIATIAFIIFANECGLFF